MNMLFLVHLCKMIFRWFFHFFKILIIWVVSGVKEEKIAQNDKNMIAGIIHHVIVIYDIFCVKW